MFMKELRKLKYMERYLHDKYQIINDKWLMKNERRKM